MPLPRIPNDVWLHVGAFLPSISLYPLRELNSTFLSLALRSRYGEIQLARFGDEEVEFMRHLQEPFIAAYVRQVGLEVGRIATRDQDNPKTCCGRLYTFSDEDVIAEFIRMVEVLPNVVALEIVWHPLGWASSATFSNPDAFGPIFHHIWRALGPRLDKVHLSLCARYLDAVKTIDGSIATRLSEVDISFVSDTGDKRLRTSHSSASGMSATLANFVQSLIIPVSKRLKQLRVDFPAHNKSRSTTRPEVCLDARAFFAALEGTEFSSLTTLIVESPFETGASANDVDSLDSFVRQSMGTLKSLAILPGQSFQYHGKYHHVIRAAYGRLLGHAAAWAGITRLSVFVTTHPQRFKDDSEAAMRTQEDLVAIAKLLKAMSSSLVHIVLAGRFLAQDELRSLLEATEADATVSPLKFLRINIENVLPSTCDTLALLLPTIVTLEMNIHRVSADDGFVMSRNDAKQLQDAEALRLQPYSISGFLLRRFRSPTAAENAFTVEMRSRQYAAWAVRRICVRLEYDARCGNDRPPAYAETARAALSQAVPRAEEVACGGDNRAWHSRSK